MADASTETVANVNCTSSSEASLQEASADAGKTENDDTFKTPVMAAIKPKMIEENESKKSNGSAVDKSDKKTAENDEGFALPVGLPSVSKSQKKEDANAKRSPVSMSFRSKFAIPADIYKAPKVAAFMTDRPVGAKKAEKEDRTLPDQKEEKGQSTDPAKPKPPPAKLTYEAPEWSMKPEDDKYIFEILKMGAIVGKNSLSKQEFFVVGRLADCHIKMEHPSISRYHAVVQYGAPVPDSENVELQKDGTPGFYVYDLGSTHGTIINKMPIQPKTYYRIKVGHVVKFGGSTRMFILQGPPEDQEEQSKESATELREFNKQKIKKKKDLERMMLGEDSSSDEEDNKKSKRRGNADSGGVTWGMLEDAVQSSSDEEEEEEGDSLDMHPDAIKLHIKKDPFYVKDPLKALKNLYEREKMELDFECNERRSGHWHVRLCLPVDGPGGKPVYAEANATGKKKDTITQCSLEACRILERHGMFHHTDHHKQKAKQWEKDDFYDSDEDEFHDRTGELQKKRTQRMERVGKVSKTPKTVETYESLCKKVEDLTKELNEIEGKLQKDKEATKMNADSIDPLDAFMQQVKSGKALDTTTRAKLKHRLFEVKKEHARLSKLADLARPSSLPPLTSSFTKTYSFIGKMKAKKKAATFLRPIQQPEVLEDGGAGGNMEEEDDEDTRKEEKTKNTKVVKLVDIETANEKKTLTTDSAAERQTDVEKVAKLPPGDIRRTENTVDTSGQDTDVPPNEKNVKSNNIAATIDKTAGSASVPHGRPSRKRMLGPTLPLELKERLIAEQEELDGQHYGNEDDTEPKKRRRRVRKAKPQSTKSKVEYSDDPNYSAWLPPEDQTGDGKTSLNEKLGY